MRYIVIIYTLLSTGNSYVYASSKSSILSKKNNLELQMDSIKTTDNGSIMPVIDDISYTHQINDKHSFEIRRHLFEVDKLHFRSAEYESNVGTHFLTYRYTVWSNEHNRITVGPALLTRRINMRIDDLNTIYRDNQVALSISWYASLPHDFFVTFDTYLNYIGSDRNFFDSEITCSRPILNSPLYVGVGFHTQTHRRDVMGEVAIFRASHLTLVIGMIF